MVVVKGFRLSQYLPVYKLYFQPLVTKVSENLSPFFLSLIPNLDQWQEKKIACFIILFHFY